MSQAGWRRVIVCRCVWSRRVLHVRWDRGAQVWFMSAPYVLSVKAMPWWLITAVVETGCRTSEPSGPLLRHRAALGRGFESHSLRTAGVHHTLWFSSEATFKSSFWGTLYSTGVFKSLLLLKPNSLHQRLSNDAPVYLSLYLFPHQNNCFSLLSTSTMHLHPFLMAHFVYSLDCLLIHMYCIYICLNVMPVRLFCVCVCKCTSQANVCECFCSISFSKNFIFKFFQVSWSEYIELSLVAWKFQKPHSIPLKNVYYYSVKANQPKLWLNCHPTRTKIL